MTTEFTADLDLYSDSLNFANVTNVPCYRVDHIAKALDIEIGQHNWAVMLDKYKLCMDAVGVISSNRKGKKVHYLVATNAIRNLVKDHALKLFRHDVVMHHTENNCLTFPKGEARRFVKYREGNIRRT